MQLSVIILNYNVRYFLELCVQSVLEATKSIEAEVIVVDNNSSDDSCVIIKSKYPQVKLIENKENTGFPKGNNIGVSHATGEYVCILNPDTVVAEDTFDILLKFAQTKNDLGIVGCKLIDGTGNFLPESKRGIPTPWVAFTKISGLYKIVPNWPICNQYYAQYLSKNETGKVAVLVGAFMLMKRSLYEELHGFDEGCFMYADDIDLSYRALQSGKTNYYCADTTVIHYKGESTVRNVLYMKRFQEAMTFFYSKHFKSYLWFKYVMKFGILFFSTFKTFQGKSIKNTKPQQYLYCSSELKRWEELQPIFQNNVHFCDLNAEKAVNSWLGFKGKSIEFLLENQVLSFKKCIQFIENQSQKNVTFKIIPKNSNFLIGSNSSIDKGEVLIIKK